MTAGTQRLRDVFLTCLENDDPQQVFDAIDKGHIPVDAIYQHNSLLHLASAKGRKELVEGLLLRQANPNTRSEVRQEDEEIGTIF